MAGIGFELKKIYKEDSFIHMIASMGYSTIVTIGPTMVVILVILLQYRILSYTSIGYAERELLSSTLLYIFIFATILTAPGNAVFSRYVADKIYEEKYEDILPSYKTGCLYHILLASIIGVLFFGRLYVVGDVSLVYCMGGFFLWQITVLMFFSMTYLYATKDYNIVALDYFLGMLSGLGMSALLRYGLQVDIILSLLYGFLSGCLVTLVLEAGYICYCFEDSSHRYFECLTYLRKQKKIFWANLCYFIGLYVHNFVFWSTSGRTTVAHTFVSMQNYDLASSLALFTNIPMIVIFTVMAETKFHDAYEAYLSHVIGTTYNQMERKKRQLLHIMIQNIKTVFSIQSIITMVLFLCISIFSPLFGYGGITMKIYPALTVAYLFVFLFYGNMIYLFYFDDNIGALISSSVFLTGTLAGSLITKQLSFTWYGFGLIFGGLIAWSVSYARLAYLEHILDEHIYCNQRITKTIRKKKPKNIVYEKRTTSCQ